MALTKDQFDKFVNDNLSDSALIVEQIRKYITSPSRHLIPPAPSEENAVFHSDYFANLSGCLIGFCYVRTYKVGDTTYKLRTTIEDDRVTFISVGVQVGEGQCVYYFRSNDSGMFDPIEAVTEDWELVVRQYQSSRASVINALKEYVDSRTRQAYATYRDLKRFMEAEANKISADFQQGTIF